MSEQSDHTFGFISMESASEKVPNIVEIDSQVSDPVISYHATQLLAMPEGRRAGALVTVGGNGKASDEKLATQ